MITKQQLEKIGIATSWADTINIGFSEYAITDTNEKAMFLAQCCHESANFKRLEESFNYKPDTLLKTFPKYIKDLEHAKELLSKGNQAVANHVYNGRNGNIPNSNDGYKYRGRGVIQLTGRANYNEYSKRTGIDLIHTPDFAKDREISLRIALEFWIANKLGIHAKKCDTKTVTKIINGGYNGLAERGELFIKIKNILENK